MSDIDPTGTPLPRPASGAGQDAHECLHPELIDDVRQQRRRRWPVILAVLALAGGSVGTIATCLYAQGEAQGQTIQRIEAVEDRAREDRVEADRQRERQRQDVTDAVQRHEELIQELHRLDSRLGRIEERLPPRR